MRYNNIERAVFLRRPNRFIAHVELDGAEEVCHVKNTGRCRELLIPGCEVYCQRSDNPNRRTRYDLIAVRKGNLLINMDSQAPNAAVKEWLLRGGLGRADVIKPEQTFGASRFDFYLERGGRGMYLEVKGVTLEEDGICRFPDAPTLRGVKHLRELAAAKAHGFDAALLFVVQMSPVKWVEPNDLTDPTFGAALREVAAAGVEVLAVDCRVSPDSMEIYNRTDVRL